MNLGYVKVATFSNEIKVADVDFNLSAIKKGIDLAEQSGVHILTFPELSLTGSTCGELFYSGTLLSAAKDALKELAKYTVGKNMIIFVGLPIENDGQIYNAVAGITDGTILGFVPKSVNIGANCNIFANASDKLSFVNLGGGKEHDFIPFGKKVIFADQNNQSLKVGVSFSNGLDNDLTFDGARIIVVPAADNEFSGEPQKRKNTLSVLSNKYACAYLYANAGYGESTTDYVFSGHNLIFEDGTLLNEKTPFESGLLVADVDLTALDYKRAKNLNAKNQSSEVYFVGFVLNTDYNFTRKYERLPFIKDGEEEFLLNIQAHALKKRIEHTYSKTVVLGLSGGLDSTLALIVAVKAIKLLDRPTKDVLAITMPCFGTSSRTLDNSIKLAKAFGVTLKKVEITKSVRRHLKDLNHPEDIHDAAYENAQARERTQVLMDTANMCGGLVVGTGDLSELALGWATYNGDHMSMYAVNGSIPKTLVRHLTTFVANNSKGKLKAVLLDILDTPVSPELIPSKDDKIGQVTEDIVGPYILHDFFLYNFIRRGFTPKKIYYAAVNTFKGEYDEITILKWLKTFTRRFFNQQFKRSCMPDGVKVSEISLSPRGGFNMPSDAISKLWLDELENL